MSLNKFPYDKFSPFADCVQRYKKHARDDGMGGKYLKIGLCWRKTRINQSIKNLHKF